MGKEVVRGGSEKVVLIGPQILVASDQEESYNVERVQSVVRVPVTRLIIRVYMGYGEPQKC